MTAVFHPKKDKQRWEVIEHEDQWYRIWKIKNEGWMYAPEWTYLGDVPDSYPPIHEIIRKI